MKSEQLVKQYARVPVTYQAAKDFFIELCPYRVVKVEKDEERQVAVFYIDIPGIYGSATLYTFPKTIEGLPEAYFVPLWLRNLLDGWGFGREANFEDSNRASWDG